MFVVLCTKYSYTATSIPTAERMKSCRRPMAVSVYLINNCYVDVSDNTQTTLFKTMKESEQQAAQSRVH